VTGALKTGCILIGTSGFDYPHWREGVFYPSKLPRTRLLPYYAERFRTVELNSPFYRLPTAERFEHWKSLTPSDFIFAVKASRYITHIRQLNECEAPILTLMERVNRLSPRLGAVLFQLPPTFQINLERLRLFLLALPEGPHWVFEFRHPSWLRDRVYRLLQEQQACFCVPVGGKSGMDAAVVTGPAMYIRMHRGRGQDGRFTTRELQHWTKWISQARDGRPAYAYFNNDWQGFAVKDAISLRRMLGIER
jgi:uncharacterized protein YecE (DUF72 family)